MGLETALSSLEDVAVFVLEGVDEAVARLREAALVALLAGGGAWASGVVVDGGALGEDADATSDVEGSLTWFGDEYCF